MEFLLSTQYFNGFYFSVTFKVLIFRLASNSRMVEELLNLAILCSLLS